MGRQISTTSAAEELHISGRRVRYLVQAGRIPAERNGRRYTLDSSDLDAVRVRKDGRPRKNF